MIDVRENDFSIDEVVENTRKPEMGAIALFLGTVRNFSRGKAVERLEFESYEGLDVEKLEEVRKETIDRFGVTDVSIIHRIGTLQVGENIVVIVVGSAHRDEAFKGCRYAIDRLKEIVPIWKKEFFEGGSYWVGEEEAMDRESMAKDTRVSMVDISQKELSLRTAIAEGFAILAPETVEAIRLQKTKKGDVLSVSETAGILAAKKTWDLIPLCHQIPLSSVGVSFEFLEDRVKAVCEVTATYSTGVEMEALVGVTTALLSVWDMVKYLEKDEDGQYPTSRLEGIQVTEKRKSVVE
ncbi:MAG: cyclic pyranopterin monophosphate synthase MoaC [Candidatus Thorarchaeota archaeon]|nr:MAG: cyclic pyranopterin monophosphate synthase MoaC [Candidatus Thorarchaeota archaeon]